MTEDILERAKAADLDLLAIIDWGKLRDLFGELIAEVERLRSYPPDIYEVKCKCGNLIRIDNGHLYSKIAAKDARIKELEAALAEYEWKKSFLPSGLNLPEDYFEDLVE